VSITNFKSEASFAVYLEWSLGSYTLNKYPSFNLQCYSKSNSLLYLAKSEYSTSGDGYSTSSSYLLLFSNYKNRYLESKTF
jgi:hypothetical protein